MSVFLMVKARIIKKYVRKLMGGRRMICVDSLESYQVTSSQCVSILKKNIT